MDSSRWTKAVAGENPALEGGRQTRGHLNELAGEDCRGGMKTASCLGRVNVVIWRLTRAVFSLGEEAECLTLERS